jgi:integrase
MGEIRKRGGIYWIRFYRGGRRYEESVRSSSWEVARDRLREREGDIAKGVPVTSKAGRYRFEDAAKAIEAEYAVNQRKSSDNLERRIRLHLSPAFGGRRMSEITAADATRFAADRLKAGASAAEINRELAILKRMFSLAIKAGILTYKPHIAMLEERNVRAGFFDRESFEAVRAALPAAVRPVVTFAFVTGWRIKSEVLPIEWRQVDRERGEVRLDPGTTKNREGRVFPFTDELTRLFADLWTQHEALREKGTICRYVFQRNGKAIKSLRGAWEKACEAAGQPGRIPHDLRRSAVRTMERSGLSRSVAMQLTGHKTESVYRRYAITSEADLREGVAKLNAPPLAATGTTGTKEGQSKRSGTVSRFRKARK